MWQPLSPLTCTPAAKYDALRHPMPNIPILSPLFLVLVVLVLFLASSLKIIYEYQRAVVFQLGRFQKV
ncbi:MAG: hypothetical protein B7Z83_11475, partial [Thiomonas sp. 20-64-5]